MSLYVHMAHYDCERCGFSTEYKNNFRSHLNRKFICKPIFSVTDIEEIKTAYGMQYGKTPKKVRVEKINSRTPKCTPNVPLAYPKCTPNVPLGEKMFQCQHCDRTFSNRRHKWRHEKHNCKAKKNKDMIYDKIEDVIIEMTKLREDNEALKKAMTTQGNNIKVNSGNSNSGNSNNSNNNIIINNFGKENTKYLQGNLMKQLTSKPFTCIPKLVKLTHFNKNYPENHNIRFRNKKHPLGEVYKDAQWQFENKKILIEDLFTKSYKTVEDYVEEENEKIGENMMKNIERIEINWINKDTEICKIIELEVLNGTNDCGL